MALVFSIVIDKIAHFNFQHPQGQVESFIQKLKASCCFPIASRSQSLWEQFCVPRNARKKCVLKNFSSITAERWVLFNINQQGKALQAWTTTVLWDMDLWNLENTFRSPWSEQGLKHGVDAWEKAVWSKYFYWAIGWSWLWHSTPPRIKFLHLWNGGCDSDLLHKGFRDLLQVYERYVAIWCPK